MADLPRSLNATMQVRILAAHDLGVLGMSHALQAKKSWVLWHFTDGAVCNIGDVKRLGGGNLATDSCYFGHPGDGLRLRFSPGSRYRYLLFTLLDRAVVMGDGQAMGLRGPVHPRPLATVDLDLPAEIPDGLQASCRSMMQRCCSLWWRSTAAHLRANHLLAGWLLDWFDHLRGAEVEAESAPGSLAHQLECLIEDHLTRGCTATDLARMLNLSRSQLQRRLRAEVGQSPGALIDRARERRALALLADPARPVSEVARRCGYDPPHNFSRWFRQRFGIAPSEWRRGIRP